MTVTTYPKRIVLSFCIGVALVCADRPMIGEETEGSGAPTAEQQLEEKLKSAFRATTVSVGEGGVATIVYDFESKNTDLTADWLPGIDQMERRVRWARGDEGTFRTVEHGIIIADHGIWMHKALWKNLTMSVRYLSMSALQGGHLLVAGFAYNKEKSIAGGNFGHQCVRLNGERLADKPIPEAFPGSVAEKEYNFGMELKDGVLYATKDGKHTADTEEKPKFLKDLSPGRAALVWKGRVNGFVFKITLEGTLDPEWLKTLK